LANIHSQLVCPSFSKFRFGGDQLDEEFQLENREDFFYDPLNLSDHESDGGPVNYDDFPIYQEEHNPFNTLEAPTIPVNNPEQEHELIEQNFLKIVQGGLIKSQENMFSYFDNVSGATWAGPEYWRSRSLRKPVPAEKATKTPSKRKVKSSIDFLNSDPIDPKVLFARTRASTLLPKSKLTETFLLPEDHQYRSEKFTRLFLRPEYTFHEFTEKVSALKSHTLESSAPPQSNQFIYDAPLDSNGNFPVNLDAPNYDNEPIYGGFEEVDEEVEYPATLTLPTEQPMINANTGTGDEQELIGNNGNDLEYADQMVAEPVKPKSKPLLFAKTAKRVDVQKLKENLWCKIAEEKDSLMVVHTDLGEFGHRTPSR
jgi:condensin complex subunit 2